MAAKIVSRRRYALLSNLVKSKCGMKLDLEQARNYLHVKTGEWEETSNVRATFNLLAKDEEGIACSGDCVWYETPEMRQTREHNERAVAKQAALLKLEEMQALAAKREREWLAATQAVEAKRAEIALKFG